MLEVVTMVTRDRVMMGPQWQVLPAKIKILLSLAHHAEPRTARMGAGLGKIRALFFEFPLHARGGGVSLTLLLYISLA